MRRAKQSKLLLIALVTLFSVSTAEAGNQENNDSEILTDSISAASTRSELAIEDGMIIIPPLFEYVTAPDNLPDLQSRTDYLMDNFWNPFDFKKTEYVDQTALNHAFGVYTQAMPFASRKKVIDSVKKLIKNIKDKPVLSLQFTKAAEESLYGPRADIWSDEIYLMFLQNLIDNKKISSNKKNRYISQLNLLNRTAVGTDFPDIHLVTENGTLTKFKPDKEFRIVEFTLPDCDDCRYTNVKLDISGVVNDMIEDGRLDVMVVMTGEPVKKDYFPEKWIALSSDNAGELMDLRIFPNFYIVDKNNKIRGKNLSVDGAIELLESLSQEKK